MPVEKASASTAQLKQEPKPNQTSAAAIAMGSSDDKNKKNRQRKRPGRWDRDRDRDKDKPDQSQPQSHSREAEANQNSAAAAKEEASRAAERRDARNRLPEFPVASLGFEILEKRTFTLMDGSVRTFYALPPDYESNPRFRFNPGSRVFENVASPSAAAVAMNRGREFDHFRKYSPLSGHPPHVSPAAQGPSSMHSPFYGENMLKRKFPAEDHLGHGFRGPEADRDRELHMRLGDGEFLRREHGLPPEGFHDPVGGRGRFGPEFGEGHRFAAAHGVGPSRQDLHFGFDAREYDRPAKFMRPAHVLDVDPELRRRIHGEFLNFSKVLNENERQRKKYIDNGSSGPLKCMVCGSQSKDFPDTHSIVMHAYHAPSPVLKAEHLGLHKALCVMMGWDFGIPPDENRTYQAMPKAEAVAIQEDLILWPPLVIIHNAATRRGRDGRMEGIGNGEMDDTLKELGFTGGKSKALYSKEGHLGVVLVKYPPSFSGLEEAERLSKYFGNNNHGRKEWLRVQNHVSDERNPDIVRFDEKTKKEKRVLYGYMASAGDLHRIDFDARKKSRVKSRREMVIPDGLDENA